MFSLYQMFRESDARGILKFVHSEKATKFREISTLLVHTVKSKVEISQNFVAFSEHVNFYDGMVVWNTRFILIQKVRLKVRLVVHISQ